MASLLSRFASTSPKPAPTSGADPYSAALETERQVQVLEQRLSALPGETLAAKRRVDLQLVARLEVELADGPAELVRLQAEAKRLRTAAEVAVATARRARLEQQHEATTADVMSALKSLEAALASLCETARGVRTGVERLAAVEAELGEPARGAEAGRRASGLVYGVMQVLLDHGLRPGAGRLEVPAITNSTGDGMRLAASRLWPTGQ